MIEIVKDILAVIGLLWIALSVFFAVSDTVKGNQIDRWNNGEEG